MVRLLFQAASALHQIYRTFPALYNSSIVASFEPKVIYKVGKGMSSRTRPFGPSSRHRCGLAPQMRQTDPDMVTALKHRPWRLSRFSDSTPRTLSSWAQMWAAVLDVLLDWAHHHLLWRLCGVSALFVQKDFISP